MKIYCVTYIEDGVYLEMCYPAMSAKIAENICLNDMGNIEIVNVEEVI